MKLSDYIGHPAQLARIEEHRLVGGRGDGMRLFEVTNGKGLSFTVSADRAGDIARMSCKGINLGFFSPCGWAAPTYYDNRGAGFLKSFTAGFFTTCGLTAVGTPTTDDGEELPLHGTISHIPAENVRAWEENGKLCLTLTVRDAALFAHKLVLTRSYTCDTESNTIVLHDIVENIDAKETPYEILYHFNFGYPLLSPSSVIDLPTKKITPRNDRAAEGLDEALLLAEPQDSFEEQCYYHELSEGRVTLKNPQLGIAVSLSFDTKELPFFTQWKLMQKGEYVLGLEPGNCTPDGRAVLREKGLLRFLAPGERAEQTIVITIS